MSLPSPDYWKHELFFSWWYTESNFLLSQNTRVQVKPLLGVPFTLLFALPSWSLFTCVQHHSLELDRFISEDDICPVEERKGEENTFKEEQLTVSCSLINVDIKSRGRDRNYEVILSHLRFPPTVLHFLTSEAVSSLHFGCFTALLWVG